jgi:hypothetical protein
MVSPLAVAGLRGLDVTVPNSRRFTVAVSCKRQPVGRYPGQLDAVLRGVVVASTRLLVDCVGPAAALALVAPPVAAAAVPPPAGPQPAGAVPAPPAIQPQAQPQPQAQTQVNPVTAAVLQQEEELQLALTLQGHQERPEPSQEIAMVDRRRTDEHAALGLLAVAMTACAGVGLARLRSRPQDRVARAD